MNETGTPEDTPTSMVWSQYPYYPPISDNAKRVIEKRYSRKDEHGNPIESWYDIVYRVVDFVSKAETTKHTQQDFQNHLFNLMIARKFIPNTPCLVNAGVNKGGLAGCYVLPVPDSIKGIMKAASDAAIIHQGGGGTGFSFETLRPAGSLVKRTHGVASGPVSFMRIIDTVTDVVKQGGVRRGANMAILRVDHPDILRFIHAKNDQHSFLNFNISVSVTDEFMDAVEKEQWLQTKFEGQPWLHPIYDPLGEGQDTGTQYMCQGTRPGQVYAPDVWKRIVESAHEYGEPGIIFIDTVNKHNLLRASMGDIIATNPCVTGDTLIYTSSGIHTALDLSIANALGGDLSVVVDGRRDDKNTAHQTSGIFSTGIKPVFRLQTKEGYFVRATANHRIMTPEGWTRMDNLRVGDKVHILNREGLFGTEGSLELGQILGWLVGDGHNTGNKTVLEFWGSERNLAHKFASDVMQLVSGEGYHNREYSVSPVSVERENKISVTSTRLQRIVARHGLVDNKLQVPISVFTGSRAMQVGFLSALFGADGTVGVNIEKGLSVRLSSISVPLLEQVQQLLLNFGIFSKIYRNRHDAGYRDLPDGRGGSKPYLCQASHDLVISKENVRAFAEKIGFITVDKQEKLAVALSHMSRGPYKQTFEATVEAMSYEGEEEVFDLTEPITESFIANGIVVHNCAEQALHSYNSCNLGSIDVAKFFVEDEASDNPAAKFNWDRFRNAIYWSVRFLDNVIDRGDWTLPEIEDVVKRTRPVGLGIMGFADLLLKMKIKYGSDESLRFLDGLTSFFQAEAWVASCRIGKEKGAFPEFEANKEAYTKFLWDEMNLDDFSLDQIEDMEPGNAGHFYPRNYEVTTIAPTGTISLVAETSSGIEPNFSWVTHRKDTVGERVYVHPLALAASKTASHFSISQAQTDAPIYNWSFNLPEYFVTAHDLTAEQHLRMLAAAQAHIDNGVSKTCNAHKEDTVESVDQLYRLAHKLGVKAVSYYRDGSRDNQVLTTGKKEKSKAAIIAERLGVKFLEVQHGIKVQPTMANTCPQCHGELINKEGCVSCSSCDFAACTIG